MKPDIDIFLNKFGYKLAPKSRKQLTDDNKIPSKSANTSKTSFNRRNYSKTTNNPDINVDTNKSSATANTSNPYDIYNSPDDYLKSLHVSPSTTESSSYQSKTTDSATANVEISSNCNLRQKFSNLPEFVRSIKQTKPEQDPQTVQMIRVADNAIESEINKVLNDANHTSGIFKSKTKPVIHERKFNVYKSAYQSPRHKKSYEIDRNLTMVPPSNLLKLMKERLNLVFKLYPKLEKAFNKHVPDNNLLKNLDKAIAYNKVNELLTEPNELDSHQDSKVYKQAYRNLLEYLDGNTLSSHNKSSIISNIFHSKHFEELKDNIYDSDPEKYQLKPLVYLNSGQYNQRAVAKSNQAERNEHKLDITIKPFVQSRLKSFERKLLNALPHQTIKDNKLSNFIKMNLISDSIEFNRYANS